MPEFYNCLVFQPNTDQNSLDYVNLLKVKRRLQYLHHAKAGGRVAYVSLNASQLRHTHFDVDIEDEVSQRSYGPTSQTTLNGSYGAAAAQEKASSSAGSGRGPRANRGSRPGCPNNGVGASPPQYPRSRFIILYNHGNAEDLGSCYSLLRWFCFTMKMDLLAYDYRGYGFSGFNGEPLGSFRTTSRTVYEDADLVYKHLMDEGYSPNQVIIMGRSLGGGPACYLAMKHHHEIAGLILESCFTSCLGVLSPLLPLFVCFDMFKNRKRLKNITGCPVLFLHGDADGVVPFRCSKTMLKDVLSERRKRYNNALNSGARECSTDSMGRASRQRAGPAPLPEAVSKWNEQHCESVGDGVVGERRESEMTPLRAADGYGTGGTTSRGREDENVDPMSPVSPQHPAKHDEAPSAAALHACGLRLYPRSSQWATTDDEKELGVFHQWFQRCGHNNMERELNELYVNTFTRFFGFVNDASASTPPNLVASADGAGPGDLPAAGTSTQAYHGDTQRENLRRGSFQEL